MEEERSRKKVSLVLEEQKDFLRRAFEFIILSISGTVIGAYPSSNPIGSFA